MPYILNKTNGTIVATVQDASLDLSTDLIFVGRNYAGYGEWQNENFLKLLENFANTINPPKPIEGQLWFDTSNKRINSYDGVRWRSLANLTVNDEVPVLAEPKEGDLWYSTLEEQLYAYNGEDYVLIGPPSGADTRAQWRGDIEDGFVDRAKKYIIKAVVGINNDVIAVASAETFTVDLATEAPFPKYPIYNPATTATISKGITLVGADYLTGRSESAGIYFWGTARHAVDANTATTTLEITLELPPATGGYPIPFVNTSTSIYNASEVYSTSTFFYNPAEKSVNTDLFRGIATSAYYADLAERYEADQPYDVGSVVVIGGDKEITETHQRANLSVAGVISSNPAYMMNSEAGNDQTHPYVALRGRVPCKVIGPVKKGELLVTSSYPGYAEPYKQGDNPNAVLGKSLVNFNGIKGLIEILV
jgi:hypothetical protein